MLAFAAHAAQSRIVSANLCADQLLLQLADKEQILALTHYAQDPALSYFIDRAQGIKTVRGSIESLLPLDADLVLLGPGVMEDKMEVTLRALNVNVLRVSIPNTNKEVEEQIRVVAKAIGQEQRGKTLITRMQSQMIQSKLSLQKLDYTPRVAFLYHGGYAEGRGGLLQNMLDELGVENIVKSKADAVLSLESIVADTPDVLVQSATSTGKTPSLGELGDHHPVMAKLQPRIFLYLDPAMTICGNNVIADVARDITSHLIVHQPAPAQVGMLP